MSTLLDASKGEILVACLLLSMDIDFEREACFDDCRGFKNRLPFDFYVRSHNVAIEYDGIQHFSGKLRKFGGVKAKEKQQARDKIKNDYCQRNGITLVRVRYDNEIYGLRNIAQAIKPCFDFDRWLDRFNGRPVTDPWAIFLREHIIFGGYSSPDEIKEAFSFFVGPKPHEYKDIASSSMTKLAKCGKLFGREVDVIKIKGKTMYGVTII